MDRIDQSFSPIAFVQFSYDAASNLVKEEYSKVAQGRVGDRFAYDEHHRVAKAWMGSNQLHMDAADPGGTTGTFIEKLTYGLDAANNRTSVVSQATQGGLGTTEAYATQNAIDISHLGSWRAFLNADKGE